MSVLAEGDAAGTDQRDGVDRRGHAQRELL
jgi:hypothetical protein